MLSKYIYKHAFHRLPDTLSLISLWLRWAKIQLITTHLTYLKHKMNSIKKNLENNDKIKSINTVYININ